MPLREQVRHILPGEPVTASVASRPDRDNEINIRALAERMDAAELGSAVRLYDQPLNPSLLTGMAVYWSDSVQRWEPALASVIENLELGTNVPAPSAYVQAVVQTKSTASSGDLLVVGAARIDLSNAVDGAITPGAYYLSASKPGYLVRQAARVTVPVLHVLGDDLVLINPSTRDAFENHTHYRFHLACRPAGTAGSSGGRQTITAADASQMGWLPADDPSFQGKAPTGAVFGYNLPAHPELHALFPPQPLSNCVMFRDLGINRVGGTLVPLGPGGLCQIDTNGIWWMSDCSGDAPWPASYNGDVTLTASTPPECPRDEVMDLILAFTDMAFKTDATAVTSLKAGPSGTVVVTDCFGNPATAGGLMVDVPLNYTATSTTDLSGVALKSLAGLDLTTGPVLSTLEAGSNVQLTSTAPLVINNKTVHSGQVKVSINYSGGALEVNPEIIRLGNAEERFRLNVPYLAFPAGRDTSLYLKYQMQEAVQDWLVSLFNGTTGGKLRLKFWVLGTTTGTLPNLTVTASVIANPGTSIGSLNVAPAAVTASFSQAITADGFLAVTSGPITVHAGDMVIVNVARSRSDSYGGEVGFLKISSTLTSS